MYVAYRIIIAGGRDFEDYELMKRVCDELIKLPTGVEIISGGARGADKLAERYAKERNIRNKVVKADWDRYGKSAGYKRNLEMASFADVLIAFWDGKSRGTMHMINIAKERGLGVTVINY